MKRHARGMTLLEILVCLAIIGIVAALTAPMVMSAKRAALERQSVSDMRQIAMATLIYRQDWKETEYGSMEAMGIPEDYFRFFGPPRKLAASTPKPPIRLNDSDPYYWMPLPERIDERETTWAEATAKYGERTVLVCDPWFMGSMNGVALAWAPTRPNRLNGIDLGGSLIRKRPYGDFYDFSRWER